ncbi:MAG TPA: hypothetical protein VK463_01185, partial [Desulfomonilaceae bacterium]|nr:hypothetical protein [Desulfomonilaceae bacterium]
MKRGAPISITICLFTITATLIMATAVCAQEFVSPAMPPMPGTPGLMVGRFYAQLSAKYRSIETFRFDGRPDQVTG